MDYVRWYCSQRDVEESTEQLYHKHARGLVRDVGQIEIWAVTVAMIGSHLRRLKRQGRSDSYRRSRRNHLLALVRAASRDRTLPKRPERILPEEVPIVRIKDYQPQGFRVADVRAQLRVAHQLEGEYRNGVSRRWWWVSWIRTAWESGLSPCDLRILRRRSISPEGRCQTVRAGRLSPAACHTRSPGQDNTQRARSMSAAVGQRGNAEA
jgi:integrase